MAKVRVLVTVDLHRAESSERETFDEVMAAEKWKKYKDVTTTYSASFEGDVSVEDAIRITKNDVQNAASTAKISSWDAVCHAGTSQPVEF